MKTNVLLGLSLLFFFAASIGCIKTKHRLNTARQEQTRLADGGGKLSGTSTPSLSDSSNHDLRLQQKNVKLFKSFKQFYDNSCAAACLLVAAFELGIKKMPEVPPDAGYTFFHEHAPKDLILDATAEAMIYQITSDNRNRGWVHTWGYSMPSNIVKCAQMLGLKAVVMIKPTWTTKFFKIKYREEYRKLKSMKVILPANQLDELKKESPNYRELKVLIHRMPLPVRLHYVLGRPDGVMWDPADGNEYFGGEALKQSYPRDKTFHGTGLSIFLFK